MAVATMRLGADASRPRSTDPSAGELPPSVASEPTSTISYAPASTSISDSSTSFTPGRSTWMRPRRFAGHIPAGHERHAQIQVSPWAIPGLGDRRLDEEPEVAAVHVEGDDAPVHRQLVAGGLGFRE
jgi:hypothetical protein